MSVKTVGPWRLLWLALLLNAAAYVGLALWFPLWPSLQPPPLDILAFTPSLRSGLAYGALLTGLFLLLIGIVRGVWRRGIWGPARTRPAAQSLAVILGASLFLGLPLLFMYPINATDLFRYAQQGRITSLYGGNPFTEPLTAYPQDPFRPLAGEWAGETTPYGPVWEATAALVTRIVPDSMSGTLMALKGVGLLLLLASTAILWATLAGTPVNQRAAYVILWAWNPALLITFVGHGHNDALMLLWLLLALWALGRGRMVAAVGAVVLAILTKPIAALALPIVLLVAWRRTPADGRLRLVLGAGVGAAGLAAVAFAPWAGRGGFLAAPQALVERLMREAGGGAGFSPATFVYFALQELGLDVSILLIGRLLLALFLLAYVAILWRTWRSQGVATGVAAAFYGYILQALNFRIWYAAWPFPFLLQAAAEEEGGEPLSFRFRAGFWFLLTTQLSVILYSHVRLYLVAESHALAHLIGVPFTFGLPFILARWSWLPTGQQRPDRHYLPHSNQTA